MFKKYTIIALGALMLGGQASGMGSWARKLWAPSAVAAASVFGAKSALCEEKPEKIRYREGALEEMFVKCSRPEIAPWYASKEPIFAEYFASQRCIYNDYGPLLTFVLIRKRGDVYEDRSFLRYQDNEMKIEMPAVVSNNLRELIRELSVKDM